MLTNRTVLEGLATPKRRANLARTQCDCGRDLTLPCHETFRPSDGPGREGAVIGQEFDAEREQSAFLVFDALDVARGPIARLTLPAPIHLGFHAVFSPAAPWSTAAD